MARIVDTSVAVKWIAIEPGWEQARLVREDVLIAPDLLRAELAQALYRKARAGELSATEALLAQAEVEALISFLPVLPMASRALELSLELNHSAGDCFFLALAEATGLAIVTADLQLVDRCRNTVYEPLVESL